MLYPIRVYIYYTDHYDHVNVDLGNAVIYDFNGMYAQAMVIQDGIAYIAEHVNYGQDEKGYFVTEEELRKSRWHKVASHMKIRRADD